jgi:hypothetical protein
MEITDIFIIAHGCRSDEKFKSNSINMFFKSNEGSVCESDATNIDLNTENYKYMEKQNGPVRLPYDYKLTFYDEMIDYGINSFGVYSEAGEDLKDLLGLVAIKGKEYSLSEIIDLCNSNRRFRLRNIYLNVCRTPCPSSGGNNKKRKTNRRKRKNKKRKSNKRNYKR